MKKILFAVLFTLFLVYGISYAQGYEIQGRGIGISNGPNADLYQASLRMELQNVTAISNGSMNLTAPNHEISVRLVPDDWTFSYYSNGSFRGQGQVKTLQDDIYNLQLTGKRLVVTNNGSAWEVKGSLEKDATQYSLYCIASGADLFPHVKSSSMEFVVIPRGVVSPTNVTSFVPLHLEIFRGTTVVWINEDSVEHAIQSTDEMGKPIPPITSDVLRTNEEFSYTFENPGIYHYYDPLDSWRMGTITVW